MPVTTPAKETLHSYLRSARGALVWKLEGLGEYDIRRPLTPTGTNLLGLVKHNRHAGHADILREQLDGAVGLNAKNSNLPERDAAWWEDYRARVEKAARAAEPGKP
jgi:hypothetical protein